MDIGLRLGFLIDYSFAYSALFYEAHDVCAQRIVRFKLLALFHEHYVIAGGRQERLAHLSWLEGISLVFKLFQRLIWSYPRQHAAVTCSAGILRELLGKQSEVGTAFQCAVYGVYSHLGFLYFVLRCLLHYLQEDMCGLYESAFSNTGLGVFIYLYCLLLHIIVGNECRTNLLVAVLCKFLLEKVLPLMV